MVLFLLIARKIWQAGLITSSATQHTILQSAAWVSYLHFKLLLCHILKIKLCG